MNKLQDLKTQLENLNYTKLNANSLLADLQALCHEVDKFLSVEYKTNIDDFADGKTKLSAKEIQDIQDIFPTPDYLKELLQWKKAGGGTGGGGNKIKVKLTACQCQKKDTEIETDLKAEDYNEDEDLVSCANCQGKTVDSKFTRSLGKYAVDKKGDPEFAIVIYKGAKGQSQLSKIKLSGCQCQYKDKEFEVDLKNESYDENKDLVCCALGCQQLDKYKIFQKNLNLDGKLVENGNKFSIAIIYGAKVKDEPTTEKCADCQQEKTSKELLTIQDQGKDIKICSDCKTKRDGKDNNDPNKQPNPDNIKKWGSDFGQLKPGQREGRMKTQTSWSQKKGINFVCLHCQKSFPMDKSIKNYLEARQKAQNELNTHKSSCPLKNSAEAKSKLQKYWDEKRKSKTRIIKTCEKCWGKVLWDKSIKDVEQARKQALSDLKYHQDKECGTEGKKKIAIYHSPNSGGNEHAPIDNSLTDDGIYNEDNEGEIYQEQGDNKNKKPTNYTPWIIGGIVILVLVIGYIIWRKVKPK